MSRLDERFWEKVHKTDGCWLWTDTPSTGGYGRLRLPGKKTLFVRAHRYSAMLHFGMFDSRLLVLHHCDVPLCVRPDHLYLGTQADNIADMDRRGRRPKRPRSPRPLVCGHGHLMDEMNTYVRTNGCYGCRACHREEQRRYLKKAAVDV